MKINRRQLRRLIESTLNEAVSPTERAFLEAVRQSVKKRNVGEGTYLTLGTNEIGVKGVLIRSSPSHGLVTYLEEDFPGKKVEFFPQQDGGGSAGEMHYNITVKGTDPNDRSYQMAEIVVEAQSGEEIQGGKYRVVAPELGTDLEMFSLGPTYFIPAR